MVSSPGKKMALVMLEVQSMGEPYTEEQIIERLTNADGHDGNEYWYRKIHKKLIDMNFCECIKGKTENRGPLFQLTTEKNKKISKTTRKP